MKKIEISASDCGCFLVGKLDKHIFDTENGYPERGIIIWYKDEDAFCESAAAIVKAHWRDE